MRKATAEVEDSRWFPCRLIRVSPAQSQRPPDVFISFKTMRLIGDHYFAKTESGINDAETYQRSGFMSTMKRVWCCIHPLVKRKRLNRNFDASCKRKWKSRILKVCPWNTDESTGAKESEDGLSTLLHVLKL
jgi:hypothetical protein